MDESQYGRLAQRLLQYLQPEQPDSPDFGICSHVPFPNILWGKMSASKLLYYYIYCATTQRYQVSQSVYDKLNEIKNLSYNNRRQYMQFPEPSVSSES
jgi:hypothetical protein